jgi:hypothetical protein
LAYVPWIIVSIGNIVIDVVATITFADQVSESQVSPLNTPSAESEAVIGMLSY